MWKISTWFSRDSSLKEEEHNSLLFKCELHIVTSFQRVQYGNGGEGKE